MIDRAYDTWSEWVAVPIGTSEAASGTDCVQIRVGQRVDRLYRHWLRCEVVAAVRIATPKSSNISLGGVNVGDEHGEGEHSHANGKHPE